MWKLKSRKCLNQQELKFFLCFLSFARIWKRTQIMMRKQSTADFGWGFCLVEQGSIIIRKCLKSVAQGTQTWQALDVLAPRIFHVGRREAIGLRDLSPDGELNQYIQVVYQWFVQAASASHVIFMAKHNLLRKIEFKFAEKTLPLPSSNSLALLWSLQSSNVKNLPL